MDKLLDEIESYWSTRTEGYSEVNEKELKGMQKKAWLETLERGFFGKRSGKNEDSENNSVEKEVFEEEFSEKQHTDKYKDHLRILDIGTGPGFFPYDPCGSRISCNSHRLHSGNVGKGCRKCSEIYRRKEPEY